MKPRAGFWPSNLTRRPVSVAGVDQRAQGIVGFLERTWARGMQGLTGTIITGNSGAPAYKWTGYVQYVALPGVGATRNPIGDPSTALPGTSGPLIVSGTSDAGNPVLAALASIPLRSR